MKGELVTRCATKFNSADSESSSVNKDTLEGSKRSGTHYGKKNCYYRAIIWLYGHFRAIFRLVAANRNSRTAISADTRL